MTEQEWLASTDPAVMLRFIEYLDNRHIVIPGVQFKLSARRLRLFACACCRHFLDLLLGKE